MAKHYHCILGVILLLAAYAHGAPEGMLRLLHDQNMHYSVTLRHNYACCAVFFIKLRVFLLQCQPITDTPAVYASLTHLPALPKSISHICYAFRSGVALNMFQRNSGFWPCPKRRLWPKNFDVSGKLCSDQFMFDETCLLTNDVARVPNWVLHVSN